MKNISYILITLVFFALSISAQEAAPTAVPTATPILPKIDDVQKVKPENLQGVPPVAPKYQSNDKSLPDLGRVGVDMLQQKTLALSEAIKLALDNNKDIEVTRQNVKSAEFDLQIADGGYQPRISGTSYFEHAKNPNVSIFSPAETSIVNNSFVANVSMQGFIKKYGSNYTASFTNQRLTTDNILSPLSPQYTSAFNFTFTQPLLRGHGIDGQRRGIEIAKKNLTLTDTQFRQKSIEIISTIQRSYWDLTFSLRNLQVQRDGVKDAKEQLDHNERLVKEGQLAPIDVVAAQTQVANLELAVYDALDMVNRAENILKSYIAKDKFDLIWGVSIVPTEKIELDSPNVTLPEAISLAMQNRPEIELNQSALEINRIDQKFYKDQSKPQVDLFASYTAAGIAGSQNPGLSSRFGVVNLPTSVIGNYPTNIGDILSQKYPTLRVGVNFTFPLKNKTAEAQLGKSLVEEVKIQTQREQIELLIQVDVRNALQSLRTAEARLRAAAIARENTVLQYESEQRKLDAGQSDVYKVLERQTALMSARSTELHAQTELNKAIVELQRATGNSLKANNIETRLNK